MQFTFKKHKNSPGNHSDDAKPHCVQGKQQLIDAACPAYCLAKAPCMTYPGWIYSCLFLNPQQM